MLPLLPKACLNYTYIIYLIGVITIIYASISTLRTIDVKELIGVFIRITCSSLPYRCF